jgi:DNA polymerase
MQITMSGPKDVSALHQLLRARLDSLRAAGIDWLPLGPPLVIAQPGPVPAAEVAFRQVSLLDEAGAPANATEAPIEQRRIALAQLAAEVRGCTRCPELCSTRTQTVFGQGEPGVELCFVGEAPGEDEDRQGLPFVGAAGRMLDRIIVGCGLKREEVYICNTIKCRPPRNRTPLPNEAANCRGYLELQIELVRPKFICALGGSAATSLLQTGLSLGKLRGRFHDFRGIPVLVTYHPAFLLPHRSPEKKRDVWEDMKLLLHRMGRPIPESKRD